MDDVARRESHSGSVGQIQIDRLTSNITELRCDPFKLLSCVSCHEARQEILRAMGRQSFDPIAVSDATGKRCDDAREWIGPSFD